MATVSLSLMGFVLSPNLTFLKNTFSSFLNLKANVEVRKQRTRNDKITRFVRGRSKLTSPGEGGGGQTDWWLMVTGEGKGGTGKW